MGISSIGNSVKKAKNPTYFVKTLPKSAAATFSDQASHFSDKGVFQAGDVASSLNVGSGIAVFNRRESFPSILHTS